MGSLSRFKLCLPQCNVPGVVNCMSGRLSEFPSFIDDICVLAMKIISTSILTRATHGLLSSATHGLLSSMAAAHFNSARLVQSPRQRR